MSDLELSDLAQLYVNATTTHGRDEKLMFVLACRLDGKRLGRVAHHFGFERTYHAIYAIAPHKLDGERGFLKFADSSWNGPLIRDYRGPFQRQVHIHSENSKPIKAHLHLSVRDLSMRKVAAYTEFLHKTPTQIYQAMRSGKYGSLSVEGALLEAASIMSGALGRAFGVGYGFGHIVVKPVVEFYMPDFYSNLGDWIGPTVDKMIDAWNFPGDKQKKAAADEEGATNFRVAAPVVDVFRTSGGDYGSVSGLVSGGLGGGCRLTCEFDPL